MRSALLNLFYIELGQDMLQTRDENLLKSIQNIYFLLSKPDFYGIVQQTFRFTRTQNKR